MKPDSALQIRSQVASIRMIYYAMAAPIIVLSAIVYFLIETGGLGLPDYSLAPLLQTIAVILVPLCIGAGYFFFKSSVGRIETRLPLTERLKKYFVLLIVRSAIFEGAFLFCFVATILTREMLFLAAAPVILFIFLLLRPNSDSMAADMNLSASERAQIESHP
jgi:hypothetical protein